ncbi:MAG: FG-GAP-like repeat-containing protein [Silvibacterium sp.]
MSWTSAPTKSTNRSTSRAMISTVTGCNQRRVSLDGLSNRRRGLDESCLANGAFRKWEWLWFRHGFLLFLLLEVFGSLAFAQSAATATTLIAAPGNATAGEPVTLTASVASGSSNVTAGAVTFYDGLASLGTVRVIGTTPAPGEVSGTATLVTSFIPGTFALVAKYNGTSTAQPSTSQAFNLTVSGPEPSETSLTLRSSISPYSFALTAMGNGRQPLLGTVELLDATATIVLSSLDIDASQLHSSLGAQGPYQVGKQPVAIVSADLNHDGIPDLIVANYSSGTVSVLLGKASGGGFEVAQTLQVGNGPSALAVADFNGDGVPDLAVANSTDNTLVIFLGNPDQPGTFVTLGSPTSVGWSPDALTVGDFNRDGILDIAVANFWDNSVSVLLGSSTDPGKFTVGQTISVGQGPTGIVSADFNGDGFPDLAVANFTDNTVWILTGDPQHPGQFLSPKTVSATGHSPTSLAVADFNGDGIPDLAVSNWADGTVSILWGVSGLSGVFPTQQLLAVGNGPESVAVGDFNGDGIPDLAVSNAGDGTLGILLNGGGGRFQGQKVYQVGTGVRQVVPLSALSGQEAGLASVNADTEQAIALADGSTITTAFNQVQISGTGVHQVEATYLPNDQSPYAESTSNVISLNLGSSVNEPQTITFPALPSVSYGEPPVSLSASASSGLPISYRVISGPGLIQGTELTISGAGSIVIEADQVGNGTYAAASAVQQTLAVAKGSLVVTPANASRYYGQSNPTFAGTITGAVFSDKITATYSSGATSTTPVGVYSQPPYGISATIVDPSEKIENYSVTMNVGILTIVDQGLQQFPPIPEPPIPLPPFPIPIPPIPIGPVRHKPVPPQPVGPRPVEPGNPAPVVPGIPNPPSPVGPKPVEPGNPAPVMPGSPNPTQPVGPRPAEPGNPAPVVPGSPNPPSPVGSKPILPHGPKSFPPLPIPMPPIPIWPIGPEPIVPIASTLSFDAAKALAGAILAAIPARRSHQDVARLYLVSSSLTIGVGSEISLTAAARSGKQPRPQGSVAFWDGHRRLETSDLNQDGRTTVAVKLIGVGMHVIKATYAGDDHYRSASAPPMHIYVYTLTSIQRGDAPFPPIMSGLLQRSPESVTGDQFNYPQCENIWSHLSCLASKKPAACGALVVPKIIQNSMFLPPNIPAGEPTSFSLPTSFLNRMSSAEFLSDSSRSTGERMRKAFYFEGNEDALFGWKEFISRPALTCLGGELPGKPVSCEKVTCTRFLDCPVCKSGRSEPKKTQRLEVPPKLGRDSRIRSRKSIGGEAKIG